MKPKIMETKLEWRRLLALTDCLKYHYLNKIGDQGKQKEKMFKI